MQLRYIQNQLINLWNALCRLFIYLSRKMQNEKIQDAFIIVDRNGEKLLRIKINGSWTTENYTDARADEVSGILNRKLIVDDFPRILIENNEIREAIEEYEKAHEKLTSVLESLNS
jgi:hypothetical protein